MLNIITNLLKPDFEKNELKKFILLGFLFGLIVGIYWFLRPIKDGIFISLIGADYLPYAQIFSLIAIIPIVTIYGKLVDLFPRHKIFYILSLFFSIATFILAYLLVHPTFGVNSQPSFLRSLLGLSLYVFVKVFGSIMIALFWAFVADITLPEMAKKGYALIAIGGQIGYIIGSFLVFKYTSIIGIGGLACLSATGMLGIIPIIMYFIRTIPKQNLISYSKDTETKKRVGLAEGFSFMISNPYLLGILCTIAIYEVVQAIFDFRFKTLASLAYQNEALIQYLSKFGLITGFVALLCLVLGINNITKRFDLTTSLMTLPLMLLALLLINTYPSLSIAMWVMIITRAINYSLNQPSKEQLYIATTKTAKYKAKAWIEVFGTRSTEAAAHGINMFKVLLGPHFIIFSTTLGLGLVGVWLFIALFLGKTYTDAVKKDEVVC